MCLQFIYKLDFHDKKGYGMWMNDIHSIPKFGVLMGIDYGEVRTGVAFSDFTQTVVAPNTVYGPRKKLIEQLNVIIAEKNVVGIIVGWPLNMQGEEGFQCNATQKFIDELKVHWDVPIMKIDERLTSSYVSQVYSGGYKFAEDDALAAMLLIEKFLSRRQYA